jgi:predicted nucleic acid-binding Zn ribbon protein
MTCHQCAKPIRGRTDKKFCSPACKNHFHNQKRLRDTAHFHATDAILHHNHAVLNQLPWNGQRSITIPLSDLLPSGFNPDFCTGIFINKSNRTFRLLYNFAWTNAPGNKLWIVRKVER